MTLVQASICENGNAIVLIADRMVTLTMGKLTYEKEGSDTKLYVFGDFAIGFAGSLSDIINIKKTLNPVEGYNEFIKDILSKMENIKSNILDIRIKQLTMRKNKEEFMKQQSQIPPKIVDLIYGLNGTMSFNCDALVVGFDDEGPKIHLILGNSINNDFTTHKHYSIGSGAPFSTIYFDQDEYTIGSSLKEGLYSAFRAKKSAEAHLGVGVDTDIIILQKEKKPLILSKEQIDKLKSIFQKEKEEISGIRKSYLETLEVE